MSRVTRSLPHAVVVLVALVISHEAIYLVGHGSRFDEAMSAGGHDRYWLPFVASIALLSVSVVVVAALRLRQLARLTRDMDSRTGIDPPAFLPRLVRNWTRLTLVTAFLFLLLENAESALGGRAPSGLAVLADGGGLAVLLIGAVAFLVGLLATLVAWRHATLLARLAGHPPRWARDALRRRRVDARLVRLGASVAADAPRAPPRRVLTLDPEATA